MITREYIDCLLGEERFSVSRKKRNSKKGGVGVKIFFGILAAALAVVVLFYLGVFVTAWV